MKGCNIDVQQDLKKIIKKKINDDIEKVEQPAEQSRGFLFYFVLVLFYLRRKISSTYLMFVGAEGFSSVTYIYWVYVCRNLWLRDSNSINRFISTAL